MKLIRRVILLLLASLVTISCDYLGFRDLCYDHSHVVDVDVRFDWTDCPDAHPEKMSVWFYSLDNPAQEPQRYDILGRDGGAIRISFGNYRVLCLNSDTDAILYSGISEWKGFNIYTRNINDSLVIEPNRVWSSSLDELYLEKRQERAELVFRMSPRTVNLEIVINNVPNLKYTAQLDATISGMSSSVNLVSGAQDGKKKCIPFEFSKEKDSTLVAKVETFGHCPGMIMPDSGTHRLTVTATLSDGTLWSYPVDITEEMHDPASMSDESHMRLILSNGLPVPKPIVNGGGFKPDIDGWDPEEIDVDI